MEWAISEDLEVNAGGKLSPRQREAWRGVVRSMAGRTSLAVLAISTFLIPFVLGMGAPPVLAVVAGLGLGPALTIGLWFPILRLRADVEESVVASRVLQVKAMTAAQARTERHTIIASDGLRLTFGHLARGQQQEWFARGGKFRFHYLPRTGRVVTLVHFQDPPPKAPG